MRSSFVVAGLVTTVLCACGGHDGTKDQTSLSDAGQNPPPPNGQTDPVDAGSPETDPVDAGSPETDPVDAGSPETDPVDAGSSETDPVKGATEIAFETRIRYERSDVEPNETCSLEVQTRTCTNGTCSGWSGTFEEANCKTRAYRPCEETPHGRVQNRIRFMTERADYGAVCEPELQTRTCNDGSFSEWSGTYVATNCTNAAPAVCDGTSHGSPETQLRYRYASVPFGGTCESELQVRSCNNGVWNAWSGSFTAFQCEVTAPASCGAVLHETVEHRLRYAVAYPARGVSCEYELQTRSCNNGNWSAWTGTYAEPTCEESSPCAFGYDTCGVCGGSGPITMFEDADGDGFGDATTARGVCPGADTFGLTRDGTDLTPNCFTRRGDVRLTSPDDVSKLLNTCEIEGGLVFAGEAELRKVELPGLRRIRDVLDIWECKTSCKNTDLVEVRLPALKTVSSVHIGGSKVLSTVDLSGLVDVSGDVGLGFCANGMCYGNSNLYNVYLGSLERIKGELSIVMLPMYAEPSFPRLRSVGSLNVNYLGWTSFDPGTLPALEEAGSLSFRDSGFKTVAIPALKRVSNLEMSSLSQLQSIEFRGLREAASISLWNTGLASLSCLTSFPYLRANNSVLIPLTGDPDLVLYSCDNVMERK